MKGTRLFIFLAILLCSSKAFATTFSYNDIAYYITSSTSPLEVKVVSHSNIEQGTKYSGDIAIPESVEYNGNVYSVTAIGGQAFMGSTDLKSISIPSTVKTIENHAFDGCTGLTSVTIPGTVKTVELDAFYNCTELTSATISEGVTSIGNGIFSACSKLTSITIPSTVTTMGEHAFEGCTGLETVTITDGATSVGGYAFQDCSKLASITIPGSVETVGTYAFNRCEGLKHAILSEGVTAIGISAFQGCSGLLSVTIPSSVTTIDFEAFLYCDALTAVKVSDFAAWCKIAFGSKANPLSYAHHLFSGDTEVTDLVIPSGPNAINTQAFKDCTGLLSVSIPGTVWSIDESAFEGCTGLTSATLSNGVTDIRNYAFKGCTGLRSISIPSTVTSIKYDVFLNCSALTHVDISDLAAWCNISFWQDTSNPLYYAKHLYLNGTKVTSLVIPSGVTAVNNYAFVNCEDLTSLLLPNSITFIGNQAFTEGSQKNMTVIYSLMEDLSKVTVNANAFYKHDIKCYIPIGTTDAYKGWYYSGSSPVFSDVSAAAVINMSSAEYATYCSPANLDFSADDGLDAYLATGYNNSILTVTKYDKIPAGEGMLLKGSAGIYVLSAGTEAPVEANLLVGTNADFALEPTVDTKTNFVLNKINNEVGFYALSASGTLAAHKAYLPITTDLLPTPGGSKKLVMNFKNEGGQTTDIKTVKLDSDMENAIYNLQGQKVDNPERGIYIVKGKKTYIK